MRSTLLIITPGFAKNESDTTCIPFLQTLVKTINRDHPGLELIIITMDFPFVTDDYSWFGNRVIPLNGNRYTLRPFLWLKLYRLLKHLSKEKRLAGILNLWCADNALVSHYFSRWKKIRHFTWLQGQDARKGNKALLFFKPRGESLIALSDFIKEEFQTNYAIEPAHIIYPGVDTAMFEQADNKSIDIIGAGSLTTLKQYSIFIEVVEAVSKQYPFIRAMIIGKGPQAAMLQQMINEKELEKYIEMKGELPHDLTIKLMAKARIFLHPSSYEGYGVACLEALASGCKVISFVSPETHASPRWKVVGSKEEMISNCLALLTENENSYKPVILHSIKDCVKELMQLYDYSENINLVIQRDCKQPNEPLPQSL